MDYLSAVAEVVLGSFFLGAIMGAIVALHLQSKREPKSSDVTDSGNLKQVKVKHKDLF